MAFDVITPAKFGSGELAIAPSLTVIRTTPNFARDILKSIDIANNSAFTATVTVYLVDSGDSAGTDNVLIPTVSIPRNTIFQWTGTQVLNEGSTIQASSSVASVVMHCSGGECTS